MNKIPQDRLQLEKILVYLYSLNVVNFLSEILQY